MRKISLFIKYFIFNKLRPYFNLYNFFICFSPSKKTILKIFGAKINKNARVAGRVKVFEPAWLQINKNTNVKNIIINGSHALLVDNGGRAENLIISKDTFVFEDKILTGEDLKEKRVTFSLDLEGGVGLSHADKKRWKKLKSKWDSQNAAINLAEIFKKYNIPATWAVCGHLFLDNCDGKHGYDEKDWFGDWFKYDPAGHKEGSRAWYMPDLIAELRQEDIFEIGYHSFGHFNYLEVGQKTVLKDLAWAKMARSRYGLELETFVLPYNNLAYIEDIIRAGFKNLRGYIGCYYLPKILDFGKFRIFGTSQYVSPKTVSSCIKNIDKIVGKNFNYFTHPEDWVGENFSRFEFFISRLADMKRSGKIKLALIKEL